MKSKWKDFGELLAVERRRNEYTRLQLAQMVGKKVSTVTSWEQGYRRPKQQSLLRLSNLLGTPIQQLQAKAGHTPEFNWYASLAVPVDNKQDILLNITEDEKKELHKYLHYLRFLQQLTTSTTQTLR